MSESTRAPSPPLTGRTAAAGRRRHHPSSSLLQRGRRGRRRHQARRAAPAQDMTIPFTCTIARYVSCDT
eukprot:6172458-Pleurochrysis_carterae.AAC.2